MNRFAWYRKFIGGYWVQSFLTGKWRKVSASYYEALTAFEPSWTEDWSQ